MGQVQEFRKTSVCDVHGEFEDKGIPFMDRVIMLGCQVCAEERKSEEDARQKHEDDIEAEIKRREFYKNSGIIKRYQGLTLETFSPLPNQSIAYEAAMKFYKRFNEMSEKGQTLILNGTVGTGKTRLVQALLQSLGFGEYIRAVDISRRVRASFSDRGATEETAVQSFVDTPCLVIDEVGVQTKSEHADNLISDIIDRRYGDMKPTVICSNLEEKELAETFGERAWDRLNQACIICPIVGPTQRTSRTN